MKSPNNRQPLQGGEPFNIFQRCLETATERQLLKGRWPDDSSDFRVERVPERELLQRL